MAPPQLEHTRRELLGHRRAVTGLAWSPSGRKLASGGADECVRTWAVEASAGAKPERSELTLASQGGAVVGVAWHPKREDQLASLTEKHLKVWDTRAASKPVHNVGVAGAAHMSWHPDGNVVAVSSYKQDAVIFVDVRKGAALGQHTRAEEFPSAVHFLGNGSVLLVGCASGVVDVARPRPDFRGAESVSTLHGHVQDVVALATDADSKLLASAGYDALITIWDAAAGVALATTPSIEYAVACLSFSCDGRRIAFAQEKGPVGVVAAPSGRVEGYVPAGASRAVAWNPRHAHILAYGSDDAGVWNNEGRPTFAGGAVGLAFFGRGGR